MSLRPLGLKGHLFLLILGALLPVGGLVISDALHHRNLARRAAQADALALARSIGWEQDRRAQGAWRFLEELAARPELAAGEPSACQVLTDGASQARTPLLVLLVSGEGEVRCASAPGLAGLSLKDRTYFREALATGAAVDGGYVAARDDGRGVRVLALPLAAPSGGLGRVLVAAIELDDLDRLVTSHSLPDGATLTVLDGAGALLARYPPGPPVGASYEGTALARAVRTRAEGVVETAGVDGVVRVHAFVTLRRGADGNAHLALGLPWSAVFSDATRTFAQNLAWLAAALLLAVGGAAWLGRGSLVRPVAAVAAAAQRVAAGDLSARVGLRRAPREVAALGAAFDAMAGALETRAVEAEAATGAVRRAEATARERLEMYESLLAATPDPVVIYDTEGLVMYLNPAFEETFGFPLAEVRGQRLPFLPEAERAVTDTQFQQALAGTPVRSFASQRLTQVGRLLEVAISAACFRDHRGQVAGIIAVLRDVTERRRTEERLRQAQRMEAVGQLAGGIAHDFNNLLTVINGSSELLIEDLAPGSAIRGRAAEILRAGERAADLTRQLLAFSRRQALEPRAVDLNRAVEGMAKMLRRLIGEEVALELALDRAAGRVLVDPGQLEQVLLNLAVNARDAMPRGGTLTIRTGTAPETAEAVLEVADTGVGMDSATAARAFEPFFTTKEPGRGTGLGLATVHGIVSQSGGRITVASAPGKGATFRVFLPLTAQAAAPEDPEKEPLAGGTATVLVAEDEENVRAIMTQLLAAAGYRALPAATPAAALELGEQEAIDLLVSDVVMPGLSGPELARQLRGFHPGLPAVFVSGYTDDNPTLRELRCQGAALVRKPFARADLLRAVAAALGDPDPAEP